MDAGPTANTKARIRLRELSVHALALVGEGANLRRFAEVRKANSMDTSQTNKALVLPKAAQEQFAGGITRAVEALTAMLDMIKSAQITDESGAQVPPEFVEQGKQVAMLVSALFDQYAAAPAAPASEPAPEMAGLSPEEMALAKSASSSVVKSARAMIDNVDKVSKGKVKMSFDQAMKLISGATNKVYEIAAELAPLFNEFGADGAAALMASMGGGEAAKTQKNAPTQDGAKPNGDGTAALSSADALAKSLAELRADVDKIGKSRAPSNVVPANEGNGAAPVHVPRYGQNLSEVVKAKQQQGAQQNGATS